MNKFFVILIASALMVSLAGCTMIETLTNGNNEESSSTAISNTPQDGQTQITGEITEAYGNAITIQLALDNTNQGSTLPSREETTDAPVNSSVQDEVATGETGEMPASGTRPSGVTRPNSTTTTEEGSTDSDTATQGFAPTTNSENTPTTAAANGEGGFTRPTGTMTTSEGGPPTDGDSAVASGGRPNSGSGMMGEGMMAGGMMGGTTVDYELSDEIVEYTIPIGTPINMYGSVMTFSQLTPEMYVSMILDEDNTVLSVTVMGQ